MTHAAHPQPLTMIDWLLLAGICSPIAALYAWGIFRLRRARAEIRDAIRQSGFDPVRMTQRWFLLGPFSFWTTSRGQIVYRLIVRDHTRRERTGWARWGRPWFFKPDTLELRWDD